MNTVHLEIFSKKKLINIFFKILIKNQINFDKIFKK